MRHALIVAGSAVVLFCLLAAPVISADPPEIAEQRVFIKSETIIPGGCNLIYDRKNASSWFGNSYFAKGETVPFGILDDINKWSKVHVYMRLGEGKEGVDREIKKADIPKAGDVLIIIKADHSICVQKYPVKSKTGK